MISGYLQATIATIILFSTQLVYGDNWAVLIAGSNYFFNYRHQADICHAYQILTKKGGIPESNIIVFMYDDIANSQDNPFRGKIFNHPNGTDVYKGVKIDYRGDQVNKENFLKVLKGDKSAGGKVLQSTAQDDVFIYYSDHGATGLVAMPSGDVLYADELLHALQYMHSHKMYKQLVFYLEACESGSMFDGILPKNLSIFATTAANSQESSYAYYYWQPVSTYLGDEYSIRWMEDSDAQWNKKTETLAAQFATVKKQVKKSHPQMFGTMAWVNEPISDFQGDNHPQIVSMSPSAPYWQDPKAISSRDVKLAYLMEKYSKYGSGKLKDFYLGEVAAEIKYRTSVENNIRRVVKTILRVSNILVTADEFMSQYRAPRNFDCLRMVVTAFSDKCNPLVEYGLGFVKNLVQLCEVFQTSVILESIESVC